MNAQSNNSISNRKDNIQCRLCLVNRCTKVITGGRRFRFSAVVLAGDMEAKVGWGFAKAYSVSDAIKKAEKYAIEAMIEMPKVNGTLPCLSEGQRDSVRVMLKPAKPGTGIVAGSIASLILQMGGYTDVIAKNITGTNRINQIIAVFAALESAAKIIDIKNQRMAFAKESFLERSRSKKEKIIE
ncbi:MAG: 30S ribosomal protein S5 [Chlamydiia bacterium]|nr:30S ribosomal protein S5 [Chlamydiia bacterium]